ncbi:hypothetical protein GGX14DRAFT_675845 [Mycena pura]|uniref:Uncharacterized protein n=1 Tax=Mycena pura TaxID=153505 RepID=A0AAD6VX02_9AGAR|nr:hypothetical protein GGX14DRAFT_675845 [Mycena pura]
MLGAQARRACEPAWVEGKAEISPPVCRLPPHAESLVLKHLFRLTLCTFRHPPTLSSLEVYALVAAGLSLGPSVTFAYGLTATAYRLRAPDFVRCPAGLAATPPHTHTTKPSTHSAAIGSTSQLPKAAHSDSQLPQADSTALPQVSVPTNISLQACIALPSEGFPAAWLLPYDDQVIAKAQWNHEAPPADAPYGDDFSVDWPHSGLFTLSSRGYSIGLTIVRHYFGLVGCIIPIASIPTLGESTMIFTIAGPADAAGKKQFYVYFHDSPDLGATRIYRLRPFASVVDFFRGGYDRASSPWLPKVLKRDQEPWASNEEQHQTLADIQSQG